MAIDRRQSIVVTIDHIRNAIRELDLAKTPICLHSSLRSFGWVDGGAAAVVDAFLLEDCTLMVPSFSWVYAVPPPPHLQFPRNAVDYETRQFSTDGVDRIFDPATSMEIDRNMGAISEAVLHRTESRRGNHPICSFSAIGPMKEQLLNGQKGEAVYAPFETLALQGGFVVLAGVDLTVMTLIHLAEKEAGRILFRRWANGPDGKPTAVEAGGCSGGFGKLNSAFASLIRERKVGKSDWRIYPAADVLETATEAIKAHPNITHCADVACGRCNDSIAGGPILN